MQDYLTKKIFRDHEVGTKAAKIMLENNNESLKEVEKLTKDHTQRIDDFRKRIQRITTEHEALKRKTASALEMASRQGVYEPANVKNDNSAINDDDLSEEGMK